MSGRFDPAIFDPAIFDTIDRTKARVAQEPVEVLIKPTSQVARVAQVPVEVLHLLSPEARLGQLPAEAVIGPEPAAQVAQVVVEVLMAVGAGTPAWTAVVWVG